MGKDDWYFAVAIGVALLGIDWKIFRRNAGALTLYARRPIRMQLAVILSLALSGVGWYRLHHIDRVHIPATGMETVADVEFLNQTVEADGKSFRHCKFQHVTFRYNGLAPTEFRDCQFVFSSGDEKAVGLMSENQAIIGFLTINQALQSMLPPGGRVVSTIGHDKDGHPIELR